MDDEIKYFVTEIGYFINRYCSPSWKIEEQIIQFIDLTYVLKGQAKYIIDDIEHSVRGGDLLCIPRGALRIASSEPDDLMVCFAVNFQLHDLHGNEVSLPFPLVSQIGLRNDIIGMFKELSTVLVGKSPGYHIRAQAQLLLIIHRLFELLVYMTDSFNMDLRIKKSIKYISEYYNENISLAKLAKTSNLNPVYFGALFKKETGMTVNRYINQTRVNQAENLLRSGEYTVNETAILCGFNDVHYFRKQFKQFKGFLPSLCLRN